MTEFHISSSAFKIPIKHLNVLPFKFLLYSSNGTYLIFQIRIWRISHVIPPTLCCIECPWNLSISSHLSCHQSKVSKVDNYCSLLNLFNLYSFLSLLTDDLERLWSLSTHPTCPSIVFSVLPTAFQPLTSASHSSLVFSVWEPPLNRPLLSSSHVGQSPHHLDPVCLIILPSEKSRLAFILSIIKTICLMSILFTIP